MRKRNGRINEVDIVQKHAACFRRCVLYDECYFMLDALQRARRSRFWHRFILCRLFLAGEARTELFGAVSRMRNSKDTSGPSGPSSNSSHQLSYRNIEPLSELAYFNQAWLFLAQFDMAQIVDVNSNTVGQLLLTPAPSVPQLSNALPESLAYARIHRHSFCEKPEWAPVSIGTNGATVIIRRKP